MKKLIYVFVIAFMCALVSCTDNNQGEADIDITACGKHNPKWLLAKMNDVINQSENFRAVLVYSIQYNTQEYILICDHMNSSFVEGNQLYSCDGLFVDPEESLYKDLISLFNEEECILLWNN
ncbi:MAG: hypothetical protein LUF85_04740 [Bacteroides sp.]|nr:hypothetical protein [Bacteroides sp.]